MPRQRASDKSGKNQHVKFMLPVLLVVVIVGWMVHTTYVFMIVLPSEPRKSSRPKSSLHRKSSRAAATSTNRKTRQVKQNEVSSEGAPSQRQRSNDVYIYDATNDIRGAIDVDNKSSTLPKKNNNKRKNEEVITKKLNTNKKQFLSSDDDDDDDDDDDNDNIMLLGSSDEDDDDNEEMLLPIEKEKKILNEEELEKNETEEEYHHVIHAQISHEHTINTPAPITTQSGDKDEDEEKQQIEEDKNPWIDPLAPTADWDYYPKAGSKQSVEEPVIELDPEKCSNLPLDTSPPKPRLPSNGACNGYDGVLHIQQGDVGGATGTIFFMFVIAMLQYADQHNLKPWVHLNSWSRVVYDPIVHGQQGKITEFTMLEGMEVTWARDKRDPEGYIFPGLPKVKEGERLHPREFVFKGTGVWNHYFLPVSDFSPDDPSCTSKPFITMEYDHITPGIHAHAPWTPRAWRVSFIDYIERRDLNFDEWIEPKRRNAADIVKKYIRLKNDLLQRAECAHPNHVNSLGLHIRHGDKGVARGGEIATKEFLSYAKAFVEHGGGSIYVATDSALVSEEINAEWPEQVRKHVVHQKGVKGLSRNDTAAFDLGVSPHRTNVEALIDLIALSKCSYLVHGFSALSEASMYLNPGLIDRSVNLEHDDQSEKHLNFVSMIPRTVA